MAEKAPIAILLTTKNEEINLPYALASVADWAQEVFVVDSGSTDRTRQIAEEFGAQFVFHAWAGYAGQKNWALDNLPFTSPWVFILDADEAITPPLRDALVRIATADNCPENGFYINRYFVFLGKRIRHCGYYPSWNIRFLRRGKGRYEDRQVHEHVRVDGPVGYLEGDMEHYDRRGLEVYFAKHNQYSTLEAGEMHKILRGRGDEVRMSLSHPSERRRWIKQKIWPKLPGRWVLRFLYMYFIKLGCLDGSVGFHFCLFLASYEHQITLKLKELELQERAPAPPAPRRTEPAAAS